ncbi:protein kinase [Nonomuraea sp. NPDC050404]|uniref:serine/threonine protein kinase n=1 Tax=Nonomuraea sp. NPDC050404 TaxID=3155783 RepID=UPI00340C2DCB
MPNVESLREGDPAAVGPYRLVGRLGAGGHGVVYLGQARNGTPVAVKVLREGLAVGDRLARDIAAARKVEPFCLAQVLDASTSGRPYIVSEYVDGPSLQQTGRLGGADLQRLAVATATALDALHQAGVVHGDLTPANVLLGPDGARVVDFGVAAALGSGMKATSNIVGTPAYMAPEQLAGKPVGAAADVFSWASVIVYAATGVPPFGDDALPAVINRILNEQPQLADLGRPLREIVTVCLVKDPGARPAMRDVLLRLAAPSRRPSSPHQTPAPFAAPHQTPPPAPFAAPHATPEAAFERPQEGMAQGRGPHTEPATQDNVPGPGGSPLQALFDISSPVEQPPPAAGYGTQDHAASQSGAHSRQPTPPTGPVPGVHQHQEPEQPVGAQHHEARPLYEPAPHEPNPPYEAARPHEANPPHEAGRRRQRSQPHEAVQQAQPYEAVQQAQSYEAAAQQFQAAQPYQAHAQQEQPVPPQEPVPRAAVKPRKGRRAKKVLIAVVSGVSVCALAAAIVWLTPTEPTPKTRNMSVVSGVPTTSAPATPSAGDTRTPRPTPQTDGTPDTVTDDGDGVVSTPGAQEGLKVVSVRANGTRNGECWSGGEVTLRALVRRTGEPVTFEYSWIIDGTSVGRSSALVSENGRRYVTAPSGLESTGGTHRVTLRITSPVTAQKTISVAMCEQGAY